jgi:hypothetical protein
MFSLLRNFEKEPSIVDYFLTQVTFTVIIIPCHDSIHCFNTRQKLSTANPTVHDRGHGYSNSFTLYRGCTLYLHHPITYRVGDIPA